MKLIERQSLNVYRLLLVATLVLTFGGLLMVWSASGVWAQTEFGSPYALLQRQGTFVVLSQLINNREFKRGFATS